MSQMHAKVDRSQNNGKLQKNCDKIAHVSSLLAILLESLNNLILKQKTCKQQYGEILMLFVSHWELNKNITPKDIVQLAAELMEKNVWPIEGTEVLDFYVTTEVPIWGMTILEAENEEQILKDVAVWSNAKLGFFKVRRVTPVMAAEEAIRIVIQM